MQKSVGCTLSTSASNMRPWFMATICDTNSSACECPPCVGRKECSPRRVSPLERQYIVDSHEVEVDERILGVVCREASAYKVRHHLYAVTGLYGRRYGYRAGTFAGYATLEQTVGTLHIFDILTVICDVDVGRVEPFETVDCGEQGGYVVPFEWGQKSKAKRHRPAASASFIMSMTFMFSLFAGIY